MRLVNLALILVTTSPKIQAGISAEKCLEYEKYSYNTFCVGLLPIHFENTCTKKLNCDQTSPLIVGGEVAKKHEFPHFALLGYQIDSELLFLCGGSLISENFILTAAHCKSSEGISASIIRLGESDLANRNQYVIDYEIDEIIRHPNYTTLYNVNDIALVKLKKNVKMSKNIRPACLHHNNKEILMKQHTIAIGFGRTSYGDDPSEVLLKVNLTIVHKNKCTIVNDGNKLESQLCLKGNLTTNGHFADTCQGDSGGPILKVNENNRCMYTLYGITSSGKLCGYDIPAIYTRISSFIPWIESIVWRGGRH